MKRQPMPVVAEERSRHLEPARSWERFGERYPEVVSAYDALSDVCRRAGPLDLPTVALVKLAVSIGCGSARTVHAHAKKALRAGVDPDALRQVALAALPTIGLPQALDALQWVEESIRETCSCRRPRQVKVARPRS